MNLPISIRGARQHNLRNLDLDLPSNKLIVFCGPSGSGKSSLAFDTLFSESRRRFLDCLSARSRQGMDQPEKPEVDSITGLPPALCLEQSARQQSSRTLLGSITEILDYLRILYAAAGTPHDPETGKELERKSPDRITEELPAGTHAPDSGRSGGKPAGPGSRSDAGRLPAAGLPPGLLERRNAGY